MNNDEKIVLLCCTGRSGSTTLLRILNSIPNSNITGENFSAICHLMEFYKSIKQTTIKTITEFKDCSDNKDYNCIISHNIKPAWYNSYDHNEIVKIIKFLIVKILKKDDSIKLWGFKEIRYTSENIELIKEFKELFPQTKVIIQIRENILEQSRSGWFKNDVNSINIIKRRNKELIDFYNSNKEYCYFTTFERMFNINNLYNIFKFLNCEDGFNKEEIKRILLTTRESLNENIFREKKLKDK